MGDVSVELVEPSRASSTTRKGPRRTAIHPTLLQHQARLGSSESSHDLVERWGVIHEPYPSRPRRVFKHCGVTSSGDMTTFAKAEGIATRAEETSGVWVMRRGMKRGPQSRAVLLKVCRQSQGGTETKATEERWVSMSKPQRRKTYSRGTSPPRALKEDVQREELEGQAARAVPVTEASGYGEGASNNSRSRRGQVVRLDRPSI